MLRFDDNNQLHTRRNSPIGCYVNNC